MQSARTRKNKQPHSPAVEIVGVRNGLPASEREDEKGGVQSVRMHLKENLPRYRRYKAGTGRHRHRQHSPDVTQEGRW